jgi:predicted transcriptional regulator
MAQALHSEKPPDKRRGVSRRSPFEIRMDVLCVVTSGCTKPTQIMYRSNTSWVVLQKNLETLTASGFLKQRVENSRTEYVATEKGFEVVRDYNNLIYATKSEPTTVL